MTDRVTIRSLPLIPLDTGVPPINVAPAPPPLAGPAIGADTYTSVAATVEYPKRPPPGTPVLLGMSGNFDHAIFNSVWIPPHAVKANGKVDVVFHLHGTTFIPYDKMGLNAVVVSIQPKGKGLSKMFDDHYQATGGFKNWEASLKAYLKQTIGTDQIDRIAVSSWSAGFAAVRHMLEDPVVRDRLDTVILLDSLHTGNGGLSPDSPGMKPFVDFARLAAQGKKTMVVTHSEIDPVTYASTTKTANVLIQATGAQDHPYTGPQGHIQQQLTAADLGGLHVMGFQGDDKIAHARTLWNATELWPRYLVARWNAAPGAPAAASPGPYQQRYPIPARLWQFIDPATYGAASPPQPSRR